MLKDKWDYMEVLCKQNGYWGIISIVACKNCHNRNSSTQQEKKIWTQAKYTTYIHHLLGSWQYYAIQLCFLKKVI